jgi:phosphotransferase system enzyme I (PtsI)
LRNYSKKTSENDTILPKKLVSGGGKKDMAEKCFKGIGVSGGIRIGTALIYEGKPKIDAQRNIIESEIESEAVRFKNALQMATQEVDDLIINAEQTLGKDKIGVLKGQKSFYADPAYAPEIERQIRSELFSAEKAVKQVTDKYALLFESMSNEYMKERAADVKDAGNRLLHILSGEKAGRLSEIRGEVVLIADDLSPSDTIQLDKNVILGFVTQNGGKTSHTSIFAKTLGIPAVVGISGIVGAINAGNTVIIDGSNGIFIVDPLPETLKKYEDSMKAEQKKQLLFNQFSKKEAVTKDGQKIIVAANIGSSADVGFSLEQGAQGVGLFRTEQVYLSRNVIPNEDEQFAEYKNIASSFGENQVVVRTLDVGGDKALKHLNIPKEENPFLGYRAIRLCIDRKDLFLTQLRAILRASAYGNLAIMFPMISGYDELLEAKAILEEAKVQLRTENIPFNENIQTGIMIEVPSAALMADVLAKEADFFSIGTNDLVQYTLAVDRGNEKVSYLYDYCNPAVIRLIKNVTEAAHANGIGVGMCGGMAGDPLAIPLLVGLGLDELSMAAGVIPEIKYVLSNLDAAECEKLAEFVSISSSAKEIRGMLERYYKSISEM